MTSNEPRTAPGTPLALPSSFSPDTLDALTSLAAELTRVRAHLLAATNELPPQQPSQASAAEQLSVKDVPGATDGIKHKVQRARKAVVEELPDMKRTREEQEREMKELEGLIERQREVLRGLREMGEGFGKGERMEM